MFGAPVCTWISAWNELGVRSSTTDPTEVAASLAFVVQSPWAGLIVPNATLVDVDVDGDGVVAVVVARTGRHEDQGDHQSTGAERPWTDRARIVA